MPVTLLLLTTLATSPAPMVPFIQDVPLRISASGLPMVRVEVTEDRTAWFVIDTGATGTTVSTALADHLRLTPVGEAVMGTALGQTPLPLVRLPRLRLAGLDWTRDVVAGRHDMTTVRQAVPEAEGILGQNVLGAYDYLIDYQARRLWIGTFAPPRGGQRLDLRWSAGRPLLLVAGSTMTHGLVLDTGADTLFIEREAARDAVGDTPPATRIRTAMRSHDGQRTVDVEHHHSLRLATVSLSDVALVRLPRAAWRLGPEVGLLPGVLFSRVYVSGRAGEAVLWPR
jgi:predicted aspartyl protease